MRRTEIAIPASTSNLGASFDTCGLALSLYLKVTVEEKERGFEVVPIGEGAATVPRDESNLIVQVARFVAGQRGARLGGARLTIDNSIPLARGLGSSSAAIIAGVSTYEAITGERLDEEEFFRYALHFEGHGDNLAPSLLGGLVVTCVVDRQDGSRSLVTVKRPWPDEVKVIAVIPELEMVTAKMRAVLPASFTKADCIFNLQRAVLLQAAISERRFDLLSESLRDRLHQPYRAPLAPGLTEVLKLNDEAGRFAGLLGVAISGAGSTVIALASGGCREIAEEMRARLAARGVQSCAMELAVDNRGRTLNNFDS